MAGEGRLDLASMPRLAEVIARFHDSADRVLAADQAVLPLEGVLRDNAEAFAANANVFPARAARELAGACHERLAALSPLLVARARGGYVRHCHGDSATSRDRWLARPFDAIESAIGTTIDVTHDPPSCSWISASADSRGTPTPCLTPISMKKGARATLDSRRFFPAMRAR
jgi:hypothetical protein